MWNGTHLFLLPLSVLDLGLVVVDNGEQVCGAHTSISQFDKVCNEVVTLTRRQLLFTLLFLST